MEDKCLMESLLLTLKGVCDLYLHGTIESNTAHVHQTFDRALDESLTMQNELYKLMANKGWYPTSQVDQQQITKLKQKFTAQM